MIPNFKRQRIQPLSPMTIPTSTGDYTDIQVLAIDKMSGQENVAVRFEVYDSSKVIPIVEPFFEYLAEVHISCNFTDQFQGKSVVSVESDVPQTTEKVDTYLKAVDLVLVQSRKGEVEIRRKGD